LLSGAGEALELVITANKTAQGTLSQGLETPPDRTGAGDLEDLNRVAHPFDGHRSERPHVNVSLDKKERRRSDHD
jgi:hypothetical protein